MKPKKIIMISDPLLIKRNGRSASKSVVDESKIEIADVDFEESDGNEVIIKNQ